MPTERKFSYHGVLFLLGLASALSYLYAWRLQDLRRHTTGFLVAFFAAFILYALATLLVLRTDFPTDRRTMFIIFGWALVFNGFLVATPPTLSDDMYRYVWDGRVQAEGVSPYRYAPDAQELAHLRDDKVWPLINRKSAVTIYPPAAEMVYALMWRVAPDRVRWFQAFMASMGLIGGALLVGLLREMDRSAARLLIFLWSPLLVYEIAHSAHVDALILPLLVGAWWARLRQRDGLAGFLLGLATSIKLFPAILLPALWRPDHPRGRWRLPLAFLVTLSVFYIPYLLSDGTGVIGFLPAYLTERFNVSPPLLWLLRNIPHRQLADSQRVIQLGALGLLAVAGLLMSLNPARRGEAALRRCLWLISIYILLNPNLFSWYLLWLLPLLAIFLEGGRFNWRGNAIVFGLRMDGWTAWWLFCGLAALSYTFFLDWKTIPAAIWAQFLPFYFLLGIALLRCLYARFLKRRDLVGPVRRAGGT